MNTLTRTSPAGDTAFARLMTEAGMSSRSLPRRPSGEWTIWAQHARRQVRLAER